ncbi:MAG: NAD(P)/FAD-dependent oxidoreductase [Proteobacteria bacterium]|nr:NAD(P)/FAD-dependent oxidoreductase [Pseudomonadota bacterium]
MSSKYDVIIVGGGHNGLVCGAYMAKAGLKTLVLERRHIVGGAAVTEEFTPGFRASTFSYIMGHVHPKVSDELELEKFGLEAIPVQEVFSPLYDGDYIIRSKDVKKTQQQFARFSKKDAEIYPEFLKYMGETTQILRSIVLETPIDPSRRDWHTIKEAAKMLWRYRKLGKHFYRLIDAVSLSAYDFVAQWFESDVIKAMFCYWAAIGTHHGPRAPGTAIIILYHLMGQQRGGMGFARGGMGKISDAIAESGKRYGLEIRTSAAVSEILVKNGRATGVVLENGDEYHAKVIATNVNAKVAFDKFIAPEHLPAEFLRDLRNYRTRSTTFKINIAVDRAPQYAAFDADKCGIDYPSYTQIALSVDYLERAADDAKYGWYSAKPFMTPIVPSMLDDSLAPSGKHVVTLSGNHASYELTGATWETERDNFVKNVMNVMDEFAPGFSSSIIDMQVLLPPDIERILGIPGGDPGHGEISLDQLFWKRPVAHYADYRSPIQALYQCASSSHPGGSVSCLPGHNAAREILKDWKSLKKI